MKSSQLKILFTALIFSTLVSSEVQAGLLDFSRKNPGRFVTSMTAALGLGFTFGYFREKQLEKRKRREAFRTLEEEVEKRKKELLAKIETQESYTDSSGDECYVTSLEPGLKQEVCDALKDLGIPKSFIQEILIVGKRYKEEIGFPQGKEINLAHASWSSNESDHIPYAIIIDEDFLENSSPLDKEFLLLHEGGHFAAVSKGIRSSDGAELNEIAADICALNAFIKKGKKDQLRNLTCGFRSKMPECYLDGQELIYHGNEIFHRQKNDIFDPVAYALEVYAERNKEGYKQRVKKEVDKLLNKHMPDFSSDSVKIVKKRQ